MINKVKVAVLKNKLIFSLIIGLSSFALAEETTLSEEKQIELYELAKKEQLQSNYVNAIDAAKAAAEAGYAPAQHFYAFLLWGGSFNEAAFDWYGKSGAQGNVDSYYEMARLILNQEVKRGGNQQAISLLTEAANAKHEKAIEFLFRLYKNGNTDLSIDDNKALAWLTLGLQESQSWAMFTWSEILEVGAMNQAANNQQSLHWLTQAGNLNYKKAIEKLITVYDKGLLGQIPDKSKVKQWKEAKEIK